MQAAAVHMQPKLLTGKHRLISGESMMQLMQQCSSPNKQTRYLRFSLPLSDQHVSHYPASRHIMIMSAGRGVSAETKDRQQQRHGRLIPAPICMLVNTLGPHQLLGSAPAPLVVQLLLLSTAATHVLHPCVVPQTQHTHFHKIYTLASFPWLRWATSSPGQTGPCPSFPFTAGGPCPDPLAWPGLC